MVLFRLFLVVASVTAHVSTSGPHLPTDGMTVEDPASPEGLHPRATVAVVIVILLLLLILTVLACCCLRRRRRRKKRRRKCVNVEAKKTRGEEDVVNLESPEEPLMTGRQNIMQDTMAGGMHGGQCVIQGPVSYDMQGRQVVMQGTAAADEHISQIPTQDIMAGDMHVSQDAMQDTVVDCIPNAQDAAQSTGMGEMHSNQDGVMQTTMAEDIHDDARGDILLSTDPMETRCHWTPAEERVHFTNKDDGVKRVETNITEESGSEVNVREHGNDGSQELPSPDGNEAGILGEFGTEVEDLDAEEQEKVRTQKFLEGLLKTREHLAASHPASHGREISILPDAGNSDNDSGESNEEPVVASGTHSDVEKANVLLEGRLADVINEMRDIHRVTAANVVDEHRETGDNGHETNNGEFSPSHTGLAGDTRHETSLESNDHNKTSNVTEGSGEDDEGELWESREPKEDSAIDDTRRKTDFEDYVDLGVPGEAVDNTKRALSTIIFPLGDSDYGLERFKESGIEAMYLETPREETFMRAKPKKIYRATPLTSLKLP